MSDVIPPYLADLLREWRNHDGRANPCQCEEDLAAWVDEHLPPDEPVPYPCAECGDETPEDDLVGGMCCSGVCYGRMVGVLAGATEDASDDDPF